MKAWHSLGLILIWAGVLAGCSGSGDQVSVTYRNFEDEISQQQNLQLTFSDFLVPAEMTGKWLDEAYLSFEPAVKGQFKWTQRDQLTFSPESGFAPSTSYTIKLTPLLANHTEKKASIKRESFVVHTPYLSMDGREIFWAMGSDDTPEVRVSMTFNYPVNPKSVASLLQVEIANTATSFQMVTQAIDQVIELIVPQQGESYDNQTLALTLREGLSTDGSEYKAQGITFESAIPEKDRFKINQILGERYDDANVIHIYTNQALGTASIKNFVSIKPETSFQIEELAHGFLLKGNFETGMSYDLKIKSGIKGIFGGSLATDSEQTIFFGEVEPSISFADNNALYLTNKGNKNVGLTITSVEKVDVEIYKIYQNNIMHYLREEGLLMPKGKDDSEYYYYYDGAEPSNYGDLIYQKQISVQELKSANGLKILSLDLPSQKEGLKGIYFVKVYSAQERYVQDQTMISISDIGLIGKSSKDQVMVIANSIKTTEPLAGVEINLISSNNQQILKAMTNEEGIATFEDIQAKAPGFQVSMITAKQGEDFNYLHFSQTPVNTANFEIGGLMENSAGVMAFIYGDRNLYRPGETVHIKTIVRDGQWKPQANLPFKIKFVLPNGKPFITQKGILSAEGSFDLDIPLPSSAVTGSYGIEVYTGNDVLIGSNAISIEEFMPDRIKVNTQLSQETYQPGEQTDISGTVLNMFGPPAVGRRVEIERVVSRKYFGPKQYSDYRFHLDHQRQATFSNETKTTRTKDDGGFKTQFDIPNIWELQGILESKYYITAFDETGRPVSRLLKADIITQPVMLGIGRYDYYVKTAAPIAIPLIAINHKGELANNVKAKVQVIYRSWQTAYEQDSYGRYRYVSRRKETIEREKSLTINGKSTNYSFVPAEGGSYEVRIMLPGAQTYVSSHFYAYEWGATRMTTYEIDKDGKIEISLDKEAYQIGEKAKVMFKVPFHGRMLVTLERDKVLKHFVINTKENSVIQELELDADLIPNAFISATIIKPIDDNALPLTVAHGYQPIMVEDAKRKINLTIEAPEKSRSNRKQSITVTSDLREANIEMTIAVVDEGILQIKNYQTPDPHGFFYQKRGLMVNAYDLYPRLFPEYKSSPSNFGSDGYDLAKRVNPMTNKRVKLLALWSGTLKTDSRGKVTHQIDIPEFSGEVRIMAVAVKGNAFGSDERPMKIADPIVVSSGLPRFMSPGDEVIMPLTMSNTTDQSTTAKAVIQTTGAVSVLGNTSQSITIPPNSEQRITFRLLAQKAIGQAQIKAVVSALGEQFAQTTDMTIRPPTSLLKASDAGQITAGTTQTLDLKRDYLASSVEGRLLISKSPMIGLVDQLQHLVGYPHGCLEQTVSKAMPQIYFADMIKHLDNSKSYGTAEANVNAAISKIMTMQMYNGGLSYWQGSTNVNWWATVYAAHFLIEAQKAGYQVDDQFLERVLGFIQQKTRENKTIDYDYYDSNGTIQNKKIAPRSTYYSLYILALAGKPDRATMNYYKKRPELASIDSKYLLAAAYKMIGDQQSYRNLIPAKFEGEKSKSTFANSFHSYIRDQGIVLNTLIEQEPNHPQIPQMARHLSQQLKNTRYLSTQERVFALLALGKLAKQNADSNPSATIQVGDKTIANFTGKDLILTSEAVGQQVQISTTGGPLYYFWDIEGLSMSGEYQEEDNYLRIRRYFYTKDGQPLSSEPSVAQNDMIIVKLSLQTTGETVENTVITDMLPGGFEIENPRISQLPDAQWIKDRSEPEHIDFRDDRINIYTTATGTTRHYYYVLRAVTKGTYQLGPVSADAMYNGEYHSYHGAGKVSVK